MTEVEKAYVAGFLDGEAYIGLMKRRKKGLKIPYRVKPAIKVAQITQHADVLYLLKKYYGGYISKTRQHKNSRSSVTWELSGKEAIKRCLQDTHPYMHVKKEIASLVIEFCSLPTLRANQHTSDPSIYAAQCDLQTRVSKLTKRGLAETE